jgi:hypothetical protein
MIAGAYKITLIEALKVETFTLPLDLYTKRLVTRLTARIHIIKAAIEIKKACDYIRRQTVERRER